MKKVVIIISLVIALFIPSLALAIETTPRISDREIVERLTKLEEGQKRLNEGLKVILREMDKRFEAIDKRFEDMSAQFDRLALIFTGIMAATIGFAIWDRRTIMKPFEKKVKKIEDEIADNRPKLQALVDALRSLSKTDKRVADVLRSFNLL